MVGDPRETARSPLGAILWALVAGALAGATVGALECAFGTGGVAPRHASWGASLLGFSTVAYAAIGAVCSVPAALLSTFLARQHADRDRVVILASGLGVLLGVGGFVTTSVVGTTLLPIGVVFFALCAYLASDLLLRAPSRSLARPAGWLGLFGTGLSLAVLFGAKTYGVGASLAVYGILGATGLLLGAWSVLSPARWRAWTSAIASAAAVLSASSITPGMPERVGSFRARPNVLLITLDTLRADHLGCYGYESARTPNIDALASQGVLFEDAVTAANTTSPSHVTMLSGLMPIEHGIVNNGIPISRDVELLPELLMREGYATAAAVSGFTLVDEACGIARRFHWYGDNLLSLQWLPDVALELRVFQALQRMGARYGFELWRADRPAAETVADALTWLDAFRENEPQRPYFLWVHCYDPHAPYEPPPPYDTMHDPDYDGELHGNWYAYSTEERQEIVSDQEALDHLVALYDGEISYVDEHVGRLLEAVEGEDTLVILTADHGEGLGEHGYFFDHGTFLYDTELHVPLIVRFPDGSRAGLRVAEEVRTVDLTPTILEYLDATRPEVSSGVSFLPLLDGASDERPSIVMSFLAGELSGYALEGRKFAMRALGHKLIQTTEFWLDSERVPERREFFDLAADPGEQSNLLGAEPLPPDKQRILDSMAEQLGAWREIADQLEGETELSEEMRDRLGTIGYF